MSAATATIKEPSKKSRRPRVAAAPAMLSFPIPAPEERLMVGLGNWETYLALDKALTGRGFRVRYHRGKIEIMSISFRHEYIKKLIGMFIEAFCDMRDLDFVPWGSTTQQVETDMGGEPDESYRFGAAPGEAPELAVEVALSSGGIEKLSFWAEKGIPEVWIWQNGKLHPFGFREGGYEPLTASRCLPGFPFALAYELVSMEPASQAVREFRRRLAAAS